MNKKKIVSIIAAISVTASVMSYPIGAFAEQISNTLDVIINVGESSTSNEVTVGKDGVKTINEAIEKVAVNGTVKIPKGKYDMKTITDKKVTLKSVDGGYVDIKIEKDADLPKTITVGEKVTINKEGLMPIEIAGTMNGQEFKDSTKVTAETGQAVEIEVTQNVVNKLGFHQADIIVELDKNDEVTVEKSVNGGTWQAISLENNKYNLSSAGTDGKMKVRLTFKNKDTYNLKLYVDNGRTTESEKDFSAIKDARVMPDNTEAKVQGIVTADLGDNLYIQDETAGIILRLKGLDLKLGDKVLVQGKIKQYFGMAQIEPESKENIKIVQASAGVPKPQLVAAADISKSGDVGEAFEGELVEIKNVTVEEVDDFKNFKVKDSKGSTFIHAFDKSWIEVGKTYDSITGVVSYDHDEYKIMVRTIQDIVEDNSKVRAVTASKNGGIVQKGDKITLSTATEGAEIYYTTDGSEPATSQKEKTKKYTEPIIINEDITIKAIAVKNEMKSSDVSTFKYTAKEVGEVTKIRDIQGVAHISPLKGKNVSGIKGVVTAVVSDSYDKGFYIQDMNPDSDDKTSEGIYVDTKAKKINVNVKVGDLVSVDGIVAEVVNAPKSYTNMLTVTELAATKINVESSNNPLPEPIIIGEGGRKPSTSNIDNDKFGEFDPEEDAIDFYESLEGMRVKINDPLIVGADERYGEINVLADNGADSQDKKTVSKGITATKDNFNPERITIDDVIVPITNRNKKFIDKRFEQLKVGDKFGASITGVMSYGFGNYKVLNTETLPNIEDGGNRRETTSIKVSDNKLTVVSYNIENFSAVTDSSKANKIASSIVNELKQPDIIGLIEIQDNDGAEDTGTVDASKTYQTLVDAIKASGGPQYAFTDIAPNDKKDGGQPGGNIRVGFIYRTDRVSLVNKPKGDSTTAVEIDGTDLSVNPGRIDPTNEAFKESRKSLAAEFDFKGKKVFVIANHFCSKRGDQPLFGDNQPPQNASEGKRQKEASVVNEFVDEILQADKNANIVVLGDMNDFEFSDTLKVLKGEGKENVLTNMIDKLPKEERFTYVHQGNSQVLDNVLISNKLSNKTIVDAVNINSEFTEGYGRASDHDPVIIQIEMSDEGGEKPNPDPNAPYMWNNTIPEKKPAADKDNGKVVLFDNSHMSTSGNADWVLDGGFSDFADALVEEGYTVREYRGVDKNKDGAIRFFDDRQPENVEKNEAIITYDAIKDTDVFVTAEANRPFTEAEQAALLKYVESGKGIYFIGDHYNSDRNVNTWDSTEVYNGYNRSDLDKFNIGGEYGDLRNPKDASKGWLSEHFGLRFRFNCMDWKSGVSGLKKDIDTEGILDDVDPILMAAGDTIAITDDNIAKGLVYFGKGDNPTKWGHSVDEGIYFGGEKEGAFVAISKPNKGKAAFIGDSSPIEDKSTKYRREDNGKYASTHAGWTSSGNAAKLSVNIVNWLAKSEDYEGFGEDGHKKGFLTEEPMAKEEKSDPANGHPWSQPSGGFDPWNTDTWEDGSYGAPHATNGNSGNPDNPGSHETGNFEFELYPKYVYENEPFAVIVSGEGEDAKFGIYTQSKQCGQVKIGDSWSKTGYTDLEGTFPMAVTAKASGVESDLKIRLKASKKKSDTRDIIGISSGYGYIEGKVTGNDGDIVAAVKGNEILGTAQIDAGGNAKIAVKAEEGISLKIYGADGKEKSNLEGTYTVTEGQVTKINGNDDTTKTGTTAEVKLDNERYKIGDTITITVEDRDLNINKDEADKAIIHVKSTRTDSEGFDLEVEENGEDTGIFTGMLEVAAASDSENKKLGAEENETITITYVDALDGEGKENIQKNVDVTIVGEEEIPPKIEITETLDGVTASDNKYENGIFTGVNGIQWTYSAARGDKDADVIDGSGLMFGDSTKGDRYITAENISNGIGSFSVDTKRGFTSQKERKIELWINDVKKGEFTLDSTSDEVQKFTVDNVNISGTFKLEIRSVGSKQVVIDNITWTSYKE